MSDFSIKAVLIGAIMDSVGSLIAGIIMIPIFGSHLFTENITEQEIEAGLLIIAQENDFLITSLIVGVLFTVMGGYIAAKIAKKGFYLNSGMVGVIGVIFGVLLAGDFSVWFNVIGYISVIPAALLGGYLYKVRNT